MQVQVGQLFQYGVDKPARLIFRLSFGFVSTKSTFVKLNQNISEMAMLSSEQMSSGVFPGWTQKQPISSVQQGGLIDQDFLPE